MSLLAANEGFPYLLIIVGSLALLFHPVQGARAILFFVFGYFFTEALYGLGLFDSYGSRYHPLIIASALTILLYHSLDITWGLLLAWLIELFLITLNLSMVWDSGITASLHWKLTVVSNMLEFGLLIGSWWHGNARILYSRLFDWDIPLSSIGMRFRLAHPESAIVEGKEG